MLSDYPNEVSQIKTLLGNAKQPIIIVRENPNLDSLAAALALHLGLKNAQHSSRVLCSSDLTVEVSDLIHVDAVQKDYKGKGLIISWDYTEGSIEKVSYNIENNKFNLVIHPREGANLGITPDKINFQNIGVDSDLIITINSANLLCLGRLYTQEQEMYSKIDIINIDYDISNEKYGKVNLIVPTASCAAEIIGSLIMDLGIKIDQDAATNLLTAIDQSSQNLSGNKVTSDTLELAAWCMRCGGIRLAGSNSKVNINPQSAQAINDVLKIDKSLDKKTDDIDRAPSPDWLQPKIYRGSSLV